MKRGCLLLLSHAMLIGGLLVSACSHPYGENGVDRLNDVAYGYRYRDLDSTMTYAKQAYRQAGNYDGGKAEALNNMAFVYTAKMDYSRARELLGEVEDVTDNLVELLIADIQQMRLCQRMSSNKDFYFYRQRAISRMKRIDEEHFTLDKRLFRRLVYAKSEYGIVVSTYYYYVGQPELSIEALDNIDPNGDVVEDTAQLLNYYYNVGSGGIVKGNKESVIQTEFNYLMRCYLLSRQYDYPYWEANSLQAISEHLQDDGDRAFLARNNPQEIGFVNVDKMPDSLLAGNVARRALLLFERYGDVYQTAGACRTLAECYWQIHDYQSALSCLNDALDKNPAVENAPDLVASVREQLSLAYSALGDMRNGELNRRIYLRMQDITRQDRQLEARAEQLSRSSQQLNIMIVAVVVMIAFVVCMLLVFDSMRRRNERRYSAADFLMPLEEWKKRSEKRNEEMEERLEEINERYAVACQQLSENERKNVEQRAKVSLAASIIPFINRMEHEIRRLMSGNESPRIRAERYEYVSELTDKINEYNNVLTRWIQLRQGELSMRIESFRLAEVFGMVDRSRMEYKLKGIDFTVEETEAVVKADKVLTLFMINTIADNARRHTQSGGSVNLKSVSGADFVEISVEDTGEGIPPEKLDKLFTHKLFESKNNDSELPDDVARRSHGFGLMNCKGIIDKYRKISSLFKVCEIGAESVAGKGSRFYFRLPKGVVRVVAAILLAAPATAYATMQTLRQPLLNAARAYADSAKLANKAGQYERTMCFADSCIGRLNSYYRQQSKDARSQMALYSETDSTAAELAWFHSGFPTDYETILDVRNQCAIAAMALHQWRQYEYNNGIYTRLFRERSADASLPDYIEMMQKSDNNKNVAIVILLFLFFLIFPAYYVLYYRHRIYYNLCVHNLDSINKVLLSDAPVQSKIRQIDDIWSKRHLLSTISVRVKPIEDTVGQIKDTLRGSMEHDAERQREIELAGDELRRAEYENNNVYVSNNVLDNCLSTLKHETMYYPSRIKQLIDGTDDNLAAMSELVGYYKELYTILNAQALRQMEGCLRPGEKLVEELFSILRRLNGGSPCRTEAEETDGGYVAVKALMPSLRLSDEQLSELFTPSTIDLRFLVCKQIVREVGEAANARACGMRAVRNGKGETTIEIILTNTVWKSLKSSS